MVKRDTKPTRLGAVVKARRLELGLTQEEVVARMNTLGDSIAQSELSKIERGAIGRPRDARLGILSTALDLTPGDLLERAGWFGARERLRPAEQAEALLPEPLTGPRLEILTLLPDLRQQDVFLVRDLVNRLRACAGSAPPPVTQQRAMASTVRDLPIELPMNEIAALCREYQVRELALFGSVLREDFRKGSDLDFLVLFEPGAKIGFLEFAGLQFALADLLGREVDLVPKDGLKPIIRADVLASARVIYGAQ